tara:strand:+ start:13897 stop:14292 length:396 start_codon:yes stop_codon:yes gene_type:complete
MTKEHTIMKIEREEIFEPHPKIILKRLTDVYIKPTDPIHYEFRDNIISSETRGEKYDHQESCDSTVSDPTDSDSTSSTSSYRKRKRGTFNDTDEEIEYLIKRQKHDGELCTNIFQELWKSIVNFFHKLFFD